MKRWSDAVAKKWFVLGAIQHLEGAYHFLKCIDEYDIREGLSYREMGSRAGKAFFHLFYLDMPYWPFDDPNPFE